MSFEKEVLSLFMNLLLRPSRGLRQTCSTEVWKMCGKVDGFTGRQGLHGQKTKGEGMI